MGPSTSFGHPAARPTGTGNAGGNEDTQAGLYNVIIPGTNDHLPIEGSQVMRGPPHPSGPISTPRDKKHTCEICGTKWDRVSHLEVSSAIVNERLWKITGRCRSD